MRTKGGELKSFVTTSKSPSLSKSKIALERLPKTLHTVALPEVANNVTLQEESPSHPQSSRPEIAQEVTSVSGQVLPTLPVSVSKAGTGDAGIDDGQPLFPLQQLELKDAADSQ